MTYNQPATRKEKIANALLYAGQRDSALGSTKMLKYLYFADVLHYNIFGAPLFNTTYRKLERGPVEMEAYEIVSQNLVNLQPNPYFTIVHPEVKGDTTKCIPKQTPNMCYFCPSQETIFSGVITAIQPHTATDVSRVTHDLVVWDAEGDIISGSDLLLLPPDWDEIRWIDLSFNPFQGDLATTIRNLSDNKGKAEEELNTLIKNYPYTDIPEIENAYLAWDSVMRTCLSTRHTDLLPDLKEKGNCVASASSFKQNKRTPENVRLETYEDKFYQINDLLLEDDAVAKQEADLEIRIANSILQEIRTEQQKR